MIQPGARSTLTEALIPPVGYTFDAGVATTYSLDLGTLMTLPLQLAWLAASDDAEAQSDPIRLLEGLRRVAKRLTVFADRGRIQIPRVPHALMGLLEEMIYEVQAPHEGAFHPKCWVLRFVADDLRREPCIRLLILSRNLTDDRSWDLNLLLEGRPMGGMQKSNREIAAFVRGLFGWSSKNIPSTRQQLVDSLGDDLHRCEWELPGGFEEVQFHVLGAGPKPRSFDFASCDEAVIISPFVTDGAIRAVVGNAPSRIALVSRIDQLALLEEGTRKLFDRVEVLNDEADWGREEEVSNDACRGLHAKAFIMRRGWWTHLYVGSANCTNAALVAGKNVEVMAELVGRHSRVGNPGDWVTEKGIGSLLLPYGPIDTQSILERKRVEDALERCRQAVVRADMTLDCRREETGYRLKLFGVDRLSNIEAAVWAWPLTVAEERRVAIDKSNEVQCDLGIYASQDITSLTGFHLQLDGGDLSFGLELPLPNPPVDREAGVLALILRNRAGFLRYLSLLLGEPDDLSPPPRGNEGSDGWFGNSAKGDEGPPIFELLVKAFSRNPEKLAFVASAVKRLEKVEAEAGLLLIPPDFLKMWRTFEEARRLGARR
jgi:hypothetical protein